LGTPITLKGKKKLDDELKRLLTVERPSVIKAIEEARAHGDLSENAEYAAAKEKQSFVEGRIAEINGKIATADVIDPSSIRSDKVMFGATLNLLNLDTEKKIKYQLVGEDEANVVNGLISIMSPLARSLVGRKVGEVVTVKAPGGEVDYEILELEYV
jgi:transcription elongation factor GreA